MEEDMYKQIYNEMSKKGWDCDFDFWEKLFINSIEFSKWLFNSEKASIEQSKPYTLSDKDVLAEIGFIQDFLLAVAEIEKRKRGEAKLQKIIKEQNIKEYEIVEDNYKYKNGLMLITYADKEHEEEIEHIVINLDDLEEEGEIMGKARFLVVRDITKWVDTKNREQFDYCTDDIDEAILNNEFLAYNMKDKRVYELTQEEYTEMQKAI